MSKSSLVKEFQTFKAAVKSGVTRYQQLRDDRLGFFKLKGLIHGEIGTKRASAAVTALNALTSEHDLFALLYALFNKEISAPGLKDCIINAVLLPWCSAGDFSRLETPNARNVKCPGYFDSVYYLKIINDSIDSVIQMSPMRDITDLQRLTLVLPAMMRAICHDYRQSLDKAKRQSFDSQVKNYVESLEEGKSPQVQAPAPASLV